MMADKHAELLHVAESTARVDEEALDGRIEDDVLRLVLVTCHPLLPREARVALTLRLVAGLSTAEIARAFLTSEATMAQRLVRAKRTLSEARVPFEVPSGQALEARLAAALEVVYLIFNEGYAATRGDHWMRAELCDEALRLGRMLTALVPENAEANGLLALMELQASRNQARLGPGGEPVLLFDQDRRRWDRLLVARGLAALARAESLTQPFGSYTLQAAIAACHARASTPGDTDWPRIVALYDALVELTGSPVVELNRAVAVSRAHGPKAGLSLVDALVEEAVLERYALLPAVRADLLMQLERWAEAEAALQRAAALTDNARERALLLARAARCGTRSTTPQATS